MCEQLCSRFAKKKVRERCPAMRYGSVCSGIEAATVAWRHLGWKCAFVSEIDPFASSVLKERFPSVPNLGDFTKIGKGDYEGEIDLLVGGTPCQSYSYAGLRGGIADPRGSLAIEFVRLAESLERLNSVHFSSVQSLSCVRLFATPWTIAH